MFKGTIIPKEGKITETDHLNDRQYLAKLGLDIINADTVDISKDKETGKISVTLEDNRLVTLFPNKNAFTSFFSPLSKVVDASKTQTTIISSEPGLMTALRELLKDVELAKYVKDILENAG